jgi:putative ABC transport system permease protein
MSLWSRIANVFRGERLNREIDEEFQSHIEEAIEHGCDPAEARRAFGPALRLREECRDASLMVWLDSLRADAIFGWRQIRKSKVSSAAAILSLALAIGACASAFRLIDALFLRPLPISAPQRLYALFRQGISPGGDFFTSDSYEYPLFRKMRATVKDEANLIGVSYAARTDLTYTSHQDMEKAYVQYVSGGMFGYFGLQPTLGRLLTESDDLTPHAQPNAVLSYDYWTRRFGQDPNVIGRTFRMGTDVYQIVGVASGRFTGTEPGTMTDIFIPNMMNPGVLHQDWSWLQIFVQLKPGVAPEPVHQKLAAIFHAVQKEKAKGFFGMPKQRVRNFLNTKLLLEPAGAGLSGMQEKYRTALLALAVLVALVLLIACANVANLKTAQAKARVREMGLRIAIGAGRRRLVQLVMVESAWLAFLASIVGGLIARWSAPVIVSMINPRDNPARLYLPTDWRVLGFGFALTVCVMLMFGLMPALSASGLRPVSALKGGESPHSQHRLMHSMIAGQTAFCFLVLFVAGLFVATFQQLSHQPIGFSAQRLLTLDTVARPAQSPVYWNQVAERLRATPGVEAVAAAGWPLLSGNGTSGYISINGSAAGANLAYFLSVSPGWIETMKIPLIDGRDFVPGDTSPGVAIVNLAFAKAYFNGEDPIGKSFEKTAPEGKLVRFEIVGMTADARYRNIREPITPTAYIPFNSTDAQGALQARSEGTFIVRTAGRNPLALAPILRREIPRVRSAFLVSNVRTQTEIDQSHTVRERLLARLAFFFGAVALLLVGTGLYGVLDYSVLQRRREIGIRMALGAPAASIARHVTTEVFSMVVVGALGGLALGLSAVRYVASLFYQVKPTDPVMLVLPSLIILAAALLAALPPVVRAVTIDPATVLHSE